MSALAQAGDLEGVTRLLELAHGDPSRDPDLLAYKWFNVASDFGHEDADELVDAVLEGPLHADDDNYVTGHAHFELAVSYLTGHHGLPVDHDKARQHLAEMLSRGYPHAVADGEGMLAQARSGMDPKAQKVFDAALNGQTPAT